MRGFWRRRAFLRGTGAVLGAAAAQGWLRAHAFAAADAGIAPPTIDQLKVRVVLDTTHDLFVSGDPHPMVGIERTRQLINPKHLTLGGEWGLSLHLESLRGGETRRYLLDFGFTPEVLTRNIELLEVDPAKLDGLILSHGHLDHYGGLVGFLATYRERMRPELALFAGGETNFCYSYVKLPGKDQPVLFGVLDRRDLAKAKVETVLCETPLVVGDAFTSGHIERAGFERVLPNTLTEAGVHDGAGCQAEHFTEAERQGRIVADQHWDEHATCYVVKNRGLVVITSCGHAGFLNTIRTAMRISGVDKLHAVLGGVHLAPAPKDYIAQAVAGLKTLDPDVVIPMHCSGAPFIEAMRQQMPEKLVLSSVGSRFSFGA
jgi:7,8-dihydropterin-6-yl-methyl-4-(beta-D-ribofuranosyl)aminobenzene 5'-phosphate synthase